MDEEVIGVYIDAFSASYTRSDLQHSPWAEARRSKDLITSYLQNEEINVSKMKKIPDMVKFFQDKIGKDRGTSFDVSNLGFMRVEEGEGWGIGKMVFSRSASVVGSAIAVAVVTGGDGALTVGFCWQEGAVKRHLIEGLVEGVRVGIERAASEMK